MEGDASPTSSETLLTGGKPVIIICTAQSSGEKRHLTISHRFGTSNLSDIFNLYLEVDFEHFLGEGVRSKK